MGAPSVCLQDTATGLRVLPPQHESGTVTSLLLCGRIVPPKDGHILVSRIHAYVTLHRKRNFQVRLNEGF